MGYRLHLVKFQKIEGNGEVAHGYFYVDLCVMRYC